MSSVKTVVIKRHNKSHPLPMGNGFSVIAMSELVFGQNNMVSVDTGIALMLPDGLEILVKAVREDLPVVSWYLDGEGNLHLFLTYVQSTQGVFCEVREGDEIAKVYFVESQFANVRFIEMTDQGRMRVGGPEKIK